MNEVASIEKKELKSLLPEELLAEYMTYSIKQQLYVKYRGLGVVRETAWVKSGFPKTNARQNAQTFEKNHPLSTKIIKVFQTKAKLDGMGKENSVISKEIENNALQGKTVLDVIAQKKGEEARQLQFYVDVIAGNIKQRKKTTTTDKEGNTITKIEEIEPSVSERMKAREKMDTLLGIDDVKNIIGEVEVNKDITIKIVDTTAPKEMLESAPVIDMDETDEGTFEETESGDSNE
jgi:hypothetical protein